MSSIYLIPNFLGESSADMVLPNQVVAVVRSLKHFIVENEKSARKFIKQIAPEKSQQELIFFTINKHTPSEELPSFLQPCSAGFSMGIISEAGCPGIADPGAEIVKIAHKKQIKVIPLVGPSSILMAMMASGLNGQSFAFNGYLPIDKSDRKKMLKLLERKAIESNQTQIFIETPYRNDKMFADLIETLQPTTLLCIACDISLETEEIKTQTIAQWRKTNISFQKRPAIFIIGS
ncbi:SAM-dependent methyltransferase [Capnocytophaga felis]|uniref:S-adenosylmethionine-dependent methyltransferase n=1 Tax=Capnocytophaga felis TaxID=2267611 RepID=A0A5M4BB07_9FLAO|nr:SAM-dependent methyltransferase [Capnocytophaga felis]GET46764.1 S-adenosylmethionine-dependent methyltransferase [Capnocytophaga felis]GET48464.1 S-adenosylmethionine-dependent methyltransferase [Capnocytophaga felis]